MIQISKDEARLYMLSHHRLTGFHYGSDQASLRELLHDLHCIQLDPLAPLGTSPDLVAHARCRDYRMGELFRQLLPSFAFEHYAKERCLLPPQAFPYYRGYVQEQMWPRLNGWLQRSSQKVPSEVLDAVLQELAERGPLAPSELADFGRVTPFDWQGWKGTAKAGTLALEILWAWCQVVICGRRGREKVYDLPDRSFGQQGLVGGSMADFHRWGVLARVEAAGLLPVNMGPHWSMLESVRKELPTQLVEEGLLESVLIEDTGRRFLAVKGFQERIFPNCDDQLRILGPLDALLWYRPLVADIFGFEYIWEVYKPAEERRWGWYVCPILHEGQLVGRLEGKVVQGVLKIETVWREADRNLDRDALKLALTRHVRAMGVEKFSLPPRFKGPVVAS